ncbi:MAG: response regulator transcription factor [bacterium]
MTRILLVDDDQSVLDVLAMAFEDEGYEVVTAPDGQQALVSIANNRPDVMISDVNMPRLDGFSVCRRLRESGDELPMILLTSRDNDIDEALGLELGADDYVAKPFSTRVLVARVKALLRRQEIKTTDTPRQQDILELLDVRIDPETMEVRFQSESLSLTVTEFRMVEAFVRRPGVVLSRDRLMELARGDDSIVADRIVDTYVRRLRRKFEAVDADFDRIETVIGAGYRWKR